MAYCDYDRIGLELWLGSFSSCHIFFFGGGGGAMGFNNIGLPITTHIKNDMYQNTQWIIK